MCMNSYSTDSALQRCKVYLVFDSKSSFCSITNSHVHAKQPAFTLHHRMVHDLFSIDLNIDGNQQVLILGSSFPQLFLIFAGKPCTV